MTREQFDTFSVAGPVPGRKSFGGAAYGGDRHFDVTALPEGVGWKTIHSPGRSSPMVGAVIPAAKRGKDGKLKTYGTTGVEGCSVLIGPWGSEPVEFATIQVSAKALHQGDNVEPMVGDADLRTALGEVVEPLIRRLGYVGDVAELVVPRFDSVLDFRDVEAHGRYVAAFADNRTPIRGGRHVMHADQTLALHFAGGMSRLYDKGMESKGHPEAVGRSRFEFERKRPRLKAAGVTHVRDLVLARLDREARSMFEDCGYDREVAPVSEWIWQLMNAVPTYPLCATCSGDSDTVAVTDFDLGFAEASGSWLASSYVEHRAGCLVPDRCGLPMPGFGTAAKRGAIAHAVLERIGVNPQTSERTRYTYEKLYAEAGVVPSEVALFDDAADGDVVWLDLESQTELRRAKKSA